MEFLLALSIGLVCCIPLFYAIKALGHSIAWTVHTVDKVKLQWINYRHQRRMNKLSEAKQGLSAMLEKLNQRASLAPELLEVEVKIKNLLTLFPELERKTKELHFYELMEA